ncbi:7755_t:CDS:2, partial [Ambispora leptoticha]
MIQYKEKKKEQETGNLALLAYPVLMAADIFLYDADLIIVGQDQTQHLELATDIAQKFNNFYDKKLLKIPQFTIPRFGAKIMGLKNPQKKMSKSENDYIALLDSPEMIKKKISQAETDSENKIYYDPEKKPGVSNLLTIYALLSGKEIKEVEKELSNCNYHQFKVKLADLLNEKLGAIQKRYNHYLSNVGEILENNNKYLKGLAETKENIFRLFREIPPDKIKVVILGQDPYHLPEVADGIAFSTQKPNFIPASLRNIFVEFSKNLNCAPPNKGNLLPWVKEGIFLVNTALTVRDGQALSHMRQKAKKIGEECQISSDYSLTSAHPSPYSAEHGFFGSRPFSK